VTLSPNSDTTAHNVSATPANLSPNTTYHYRLTAINMDGTANTADGTFTTALSDLQNWRQAYYGTTANADNAADTADPYGIGLTNIAIFAFGGPNQNPALASRSLLPVAQNSGGNLFFSFNEPVGVSGINYGAQWSTTLQANDWHAITDTGSCGAHFFSVPIGSNAKLFIRLNVSEP
jgi:hypothetical protein